MINFDFTIDNIFRSNKRNFSNVYSYNKPLSKNKTFEIDVYKLPVRIFEFSLNIQPKFQDHSGTILSFGLLGVIIELSVRDNRHWNYETDDWEKDL